MEDPGGDSIRLWRHFNEEFIVLGRVLAVVENQKNEGRDSIVQCSQDTSTGSDSNCRGWDVILLRRSVWRFGNYCDSFSAVTPRRNWTDRPACGRCDQGDLCSVRAPAGLGVERPMGLGKVTFGHGRDLRPCEQYAAHVVVRLSMYNRVALYSDCCHEI